VSGANPTLVCGTLLGALLSLVGLSLCALRLIRRARRRSSRRPPQWGEVSLLGCCATLTVVLGLYPLGYLADRLKWGDRALGLIPVIIVAFFISIVTALVGGLMWSVTAVRYRGTRRRREPRCANCGYLLYGLPQPRCPECGRKFDPRAFGSR
jgi:MFS family permease